MDLKSIIPDELLNQSHSATKHLYCWNKPTRITSSFQGKRSVLKPKNIVSKEDPEWEAIGIEIDKNFYAYSYVLNGRGTIYYKKEKRSYNLRPGTIFKYNNHTLDDIVLETSDDFLECSVSIYSDIGNNLLDINLIDNRSFSFFIGLNPNIIKGYLDIYSSIVDGITPANEILLMYLNLTNKISNAAKNKNPNQEFINRCKEIFANNYRADFKLQGVAEILDMPYNTFRLKFKKLFGISALDYQLRVRMEKGVNLLEKYSVAEAAELLGYKDQFIFSKRFKFHFGIPPKKYQLNFM